MNDKDLPTTEYDENEIGTENGSDIEAGNGIETETGAAIESATVSDPAAEEYAGDPELDAVAEEAVKKERRRRAAAAGGEMTMAKTMKFGALICVSFAVLMFASIAWFTMSRENETSGMSMTSQSVPYELRFSGENIGALSYTPNEPVGDEITYSSSSIYGKASVTDYARQLTDGVKETIEGTDYYDTDGDHNKVILRLDKEYLEPEKEKGLNPGSEGVIQFWVIPKVNGSLTVNFTLDIIGYNAVQSKSAPYEVTSISPISETVPSYENPTTAQLEEIANATAQIQAVNHLRSHILFFKGEEANNVWTYTNFMNDDLSTVGFYSFSFSNVVEGEPIEVRIRWVWTNTFKQMVLPSNDANAPSVTDDSSVLSDVQKYAYDHSADIFKDVSTEDVQSKMMKYNSETQQYEFDSDTLNTGTNLDDLSRGYNRADSEIGNRVRYMMVLLGAE